MLVIDQDAALAAIPAMLPKDWEIRQQAFALIKQILGARGSLSPGEEEKLAQIARLFGVDDETARKGRLEREPPSPWARRPSKLTSSG